MAGVRVLTRAALAVLLAACSSPSAQDRTIAAELAAVAPLKAQYAGVVMGFDIRTPTTLTISVDLQSYIEMDDDAVAAMQRHALAVWRVAWTQTHPRSRATLHVRFIDFIGRKVAHETTIVR
jgi:hypothetical protein